MLYKRYLKIILPTSKSDMVLWKKKRRKLPKKTTKLSWETTPRLLRRKGKKTFWEGISFLPRSSI